MNKVKWPFYFLFTTEMCSSEVKPFHLNKGWIQEGEYSCPLLAKSRDVHPRPRPVPYLLPFSFTQTHTKECGSSCAKLQKCALIQKSTVVIVKISENKALFINIHIPI